ncbi:MAG: hypothetical protein K9M56_05075 [Victivallales bacterium]|nr:hypothetical protein [Victivallales bacterium]
MKEKKYIFATLSVIICLLLISIMVTGLIRDYNFTRIYKDKTSKFNEDDVRKWLQAVIREKPIQAIQAARKISPKQFPYIPKPELLDIAKTAKIKSTFFNPPYSLFDYFYWRDMYLLKSLVNKFKKSQPQKPVIENIFNKVNKRIKLTEYKKNINSRPAFFHQVWKNKKGDIIDKHLLFAALAEQAGYVTHTALVFDQIQKTPLYIFALSQKNNQVYTFDFTSGCYWQKTLKEILNQPPVNLSKIFNNGLRQKPLTVIYKLELPAPGYRKSNIILNNYLKKSKIKGIPKISFDLNKIQKEFHDKILKSKNSLCLIGIETFIMIKNSKKFPKYWKE